MKLYKLTDQDGRTYNNTQWGPGITHTASGNGPLYSSGWIHAYTDPLLAVLLNPIHADFANPLLWEVEGEVGIEDGGLKVGSKSVTVTRQLPMPAVTIQQRVAFGILCVLEVYSEVKFVAWATNWLNGTGRSDAEAAYAAADAAADAAAYAAAAAADAAARAAAAAADAARAAARATYAAAVRATYVAAAAAAAATHAAAAAAAATHAAAAAATSIDLVALAYKAIEID